MSFSADLINAIRTANKVAILTGAGVSAESGVPTFREAQTGLWAEYRPEELATSQAFYNNPQRVWDWYQWRRDLIGKVEPNPGHYALAKMEQSLEAGQASFTLITQNVDGLHEQAGSQNVIELHGNIQRTKCYDCEAIVSAWDPADKPVPHCPNCNGLLRPDVVWFGEPLPLDAINQAYEISQSCDLFFSIGTSALIQPAASLPLLASEAKAILVEINPNETPVSVHADFVLRGPSGEILPELLYTAWG